MLKYALLAYNPKSGSQDLQESFDHIISRFIKHGILLHIVPVGNETTQYTEYIFRRENFRYDFIIISGGDGTLNRFVTLMMNNGINVPVGIIPSGTCNDFARCLSVPFGLDGCIDMILKGKTEKVDIGRVNGGKYFVDTCAGGLFVDVSITTPSSFKKHFGPLAYYIHGLSELGNIHPFELTVKTDYFERKEKILLFLILNGNHAAGFDNIVRSADLSDNLMELILIKECSYLDLANMLIRLLSKGLTTDPNVIHIPFSSCTLEGPADHYVSLDGEDGGRLPIRVEVLHKALEVFVP